MKEIYYGILTLGSSTLWGVLSSWLLYFYLPPEQKGNPLIPIGLYGGVAIVNKLVSILAGLPIGHFSDRLQTRWGRRIPLILVGSLVMPVMFVLVWMPPRRDESLLNLGYLLGVLVLFNLAYSLRQIPYEALLPELAQEDKRRVKFSTWKSGFQMAAYLFAGVAGWLIAEKGYLTAGLIYAAAMVPFFVLPLLGLKEDPARRAQSPERLDFWQSTKITLRNRSFQVFLMAWGLYWVASTFAMQTLPYVATELCGMDEAGTIYFYIPGLLIALACFPAVGWLSAKFDKRRVFGFSLLFSALVLPLVALIGPWLPLPLPVQGVAWVVLQSISFSALQVLPSAMTADITDEDARQTGQRREGSYYAAWGLADQFFSGTGAALLPLILILGRSQAVNGALGVRMAGVAGGVLMLIGFIIFTRYPIAKLSAGKESLEQPVGYPNN